MGDRERERESDEEIDKNVNCFQINKANNLRYISQ